MLCIVIVPRVNVEGMLVIIDMIVQHNTRFDESCHCISVSPLTSQCEDVKLCLQNPKRTFRVLYFCLLGTCKHFCMSILGCGNVLTKHAYLEEIPSTSQYA